MTWRPQSGTLSSSALRPRNRGGTKMRTDLSQAVQDTPPMERASLQGELRSQLAFLEQSLPAAERPLKLSAGARGWGGARKANLLIALTETRLVLVSESLDV